MKTAILASVGARQHYEPAAMLHAHGHLAQLITDFWAAEIPGYIAKALPNSLHRLAGRRRAEIPKELVAPFPAFGIGYWWRQRRAPNRAELFKVYEEDGSRFARLACKYLNVPHDAFFGFTSAALECLKIEKDCGRRTILDQIDAGPEHWRIVAAEEKAFPHLNSQNHQLPQSYFDRVRAEWNVADAIVVNSAWSKTALLAEKIPDEKIHIVPLPFRAKSIGHVRQFNGHRLKVLFLGTLSLGKGVHYAVDAARRLSSERVTFTLAGPSDVDMEALSLPANATYIGQVPRPAVERLFLSHDVFLFPTLSDGFGLTQLEAMAYGLPVISTDKCGEVVEHTKSGFIVRARDAIGIVNSLKQILDSRDMLSTLSEAALRRSDDFLPEQQWPLYRKVLCLD